MNGSHIAVRRARALLALAALVIFATAATGVAHASGSPNLIVNGDAESGAASGSGYDSVTIPGWQLTGVPTVVRYGQHADGITGTAGAPRGLTGADQFSTPATPGAPDPGKQLFVGGAVGSSTLTQTVPLGAAATAIDAGTVTYTLGGWLGGASLTTLGSVPRRSASPTAITGARTRSSCRARSGSACPGSTR